MPFRGRNGGVPLHNPSEPMDQPTSSQLDLEPQNLLLATSLLSENLPVYSAPGLCANSSSI